MIPDEGRWPSVCLMSYRNECKGDVHHTFSSPTQLTSQEIAKLAHAVPIGGHICCVSDNKKLSIAGIKITILNEMRELGHSSFRSANPLKLFIRGPGNIEMSTCGIALVYKAGEISEESLLQYCNVMRALTANLMSGLTCLTQGKVESLEDIFNDLAEAIERLGHGGVLLIAKVPENKQFSSSRWLNSLSLQQALVRYWNDVALHLNSAGGLNNAMAMAERGTPIGNSVTVSSDTAILEKIIVSISHLAGMDGAIVIDYTCKVVAFNAIIDRSNCSLSTCRIVNENGEEQTYDEVVKKRGSRLQSALAYVMSVPDSFAFVISQDGSVSAIHNPNDGSVVYEHGLRVLN